MTQLVLNIAGQAGQDASFIVTECNREAVELIYAWPKWLAPCAVIIGEPGSGKSLLAQHWATAASAKVLASPLESQMAAINELQNSVLVEMPGLGIPAEDAALFHLYNHCASTGLSLLVTLPQPIAAYEKVLPDLRSRLQAAMIGVLKQPDDMMVLQLLAKQFSERQLRVKPDVLEFLALRVARSYNAIGECVKRIDALSLEQKRNITIPLVRELL